MTRIGHVNLILFICILALPQCKAKGYAAQSDKKLQFSIIAHDLSEDRNAFSTHNDEILFVLSSWNDSNQPQTVYHSYFVATNPPDSHSFTIDNFQDHFENYAITLLEIDESVIEQKELLDSLNNNLLTLKKVFETKNLGVIKEILGDNDILGIFVSKQVNINWNKGKISIKGKHLFDPYNYEVFWTK